MAVAEVGLEIIIRTTKPVLVNTGSVQKCLRAVTSSKAQVGSPQAFLVNSIVTNALRPTQNRRGGELRSLSLSVCVCLSFSLPGHHVNKATICTPAAKHAGILISEAQLPELWETHLCCLSHPVYGILLWQSELTKSNSHSQCSQHEVNRAMDLKFWKKILLRLSLVKMFLMTWGHLICTIILKINPPRFYLKMLLDTDNGYGWTALWMRLVPLNHTVKKGQNGKINAGYILPQ